MHGVRVVPEQAEVRRGVEGHQRLCDPFAVDRACRIRVDGHAPHALDRRIGAQKSLDDLEIRSLAGERDRDHPDAELLCDTEMPIVTRDRTEEARRLVREPGPITTRHSVHHGVGHHVVHEIQASIAQGQQLRHGNAQNIREHGPDGRQSRRSSVVAQVRACVVVEVPVAGQRKERIGQIELLRRRFATSQIEFESSAREFVVSTDEVVVEAFQVGGGNGGEAAVRGHGIDRIRYRTIPRLNEMFPRLKETIPRSHRPGCDQAGL